MITQLTHNQRLLMWRGQAVALFGLAAFAWPVATLTALRLLFGAYALADGFLALSVSRLERHDFYHWRTLRLRGLASIALGIFVCLSSGVTPLMLFSLIATWVILTHGLKALAVFVAEGKLLPVVDKLVVRQIMRER